MEKSKNFTYQETVQVVEEKPTAHGRYGINCKVCNCHDLKEDLMGTKFFIIFLLYLSNMLSTMGVKELRFYT